MSLIRLYQRTKAAAARMHRDEQGAEGLEKLLIVAAIVLPLLALLLFFREDLSEWVQDKWDTVKSDSDSSNIPNAP